MINFGLSTSWNASRHKDGSAIIDEIKSLGFDSVELNFTLTKDMVDDIKASVKKGDIRVRSLHNFCPIPEGLKRNQALPDCYSLASLDDDERSKALQFSKNTIITADSLGAEAVVLHCGKVGEKDPTRKLIDLYNAGEKDSREFKSIKYDMVLRREAKVSSHLERLFKSLDELNAFARGKGIILGVENRFYYMETPSSEEISYILKQFKGSNIFYWHDVGHAQIWQELGVIKHKAVLKELGSNIAGIHFHDVKACKDHLAPGCGDFDFSILKPYLKESVISIIEAHHPATPDEVRNSKQYLKELLVV